MGRHRDRQPTDCEWDGQAERDHLTQACRTQSQPSTETSLLHGIDGCVEARRIVPKGQHVWVRLGNGSEVPGLLVSWENRNGIWWGRVAMVDPDGDPALIDILGSLLRPAN